MAIEFDEYAVIGIVSNACKQHTRAHAGQSGHTVTVQQAKEGTQLWGVMKQLREGAPRMAKVGSNSTSRKEDG